MSGVLPPTTLEPHGESRSIQTHIFGLRASNLYVPRAGVGAQSQTLGDGYDLVSGFLECGDDFREDVDGGDLVYVVVEGEVGGWVGLG